MNGVLELETMYTPINLFNFLKKLEKELGRKSNLKWAEREIDLDILFYNDLIYRDENITIPHIGIVERDFVLTPMSDIAPGFVHPVFGISIKDLSTKIINSNIIKEVDTELLLK